MKGPVWPVVCGIKAVQNDVLNSSFFLGFHQRPPLVPEASRRGDDVRPGGDHHVQTPRPRGDHQQGGRVRGKAVRKSTNQKHALVNVCFSPAHLFIMQNNEALAVHYCSQSTLGEKPGSFQATNGFTIIQPITFV